MVNVCVNGITILLCTITPCACARGKVIGCIVVVVRAKIAIYQDLGI